MAQYIYTMNRVSKLVPLSHISGEEMLISAYSLMGTPYTPGGSTPSEGFDCSGFVRYVLLENGQSFPERSSDEMYRAGKLR